MRLKSRPKEPSPSLTRVGANFYSSVKQQDYSASVWLRRKDKLEHVRAARSPGPRPGTCPGGGRSARGAAGPGAGDPAGGATRGRGGRVLVPPRGLCFALSCREGPGCGEGRGGEGRCLSWHCLPSLPAHLDLPPRAFFRVRGHRVLGAPLRGEREGELPQRGSEERGVARWCALEGPDGR